MSKYPSILQGAKQLVRRAARSVGLEIRRYRPTTAVGAWRHAGGQQAGRRPKRVAADADRDIGGLLVGVDRPVIFDVGAHIGQSIERFKRLLPTCELHSFEPSPTTFRILEEQCGALSDIHLVNMGVGAVSGAQLLIENADTFMTSFLPLGNAGWGSVVRETPVEVTTIDAYCTDHGVESIDLLKIDTQGFDFDVLKGSARLLAAHGVRLVFAEIIYSDMYVGLPPFDELLRLLRLHGFRLVSIYDFHVVDGMASWSDALFVDPGFSDPDRTHSV